MGRKESDVDVATSSIDGQLRRAIVNRLLVEIEYDGLRIVEPHDYGIVKKGEPAKLLAYQLRGKTRSGVLPDWRWFNVSKIHRMRLLPDHFPGSRQVSSGQHHTWHRVFASVSMIKSAKEHANA